MSPFGGVIADKFGRAQMAGFSDIWGSLGLFVQAVFFIRGDVPLWIMLIANINFGLMWGIFWPANLGIVPSLVPEDELQQSNAFANLTTSSGTYQLVNLKQWGDPEGLGNWQGPDGLVSYNLELRYSTNNVYFSGSNANVNVNIVIKHAQPKLIIFILNF